MFREGAATYVSCRQGKVLSTDNPRQKALAPAAQHCKHCNAPQIDYS